MDIKFFARPLTITKNVKISDTRFLCTASNGQRYEAPFGLPEGEALNLAFDAESNVIDFFIPADIPETTT